MKFLTTQEQRVLAIVLLLILVGWAVQAWRAAQSIGAAMPTSNASERAQD